MNINGIVVRGHGVASGQSNDPRYPEGTLVKQLPFFKEKGLDLTTYYPGTINLDVSPFEYEIIEPYRFFKEIRWSEYIPAENFYFFNFVVFRNHRRIGGLIYMPDPDTKIEHNQGASILELILPKIENLNYGDSLKIDVPNTQLHFYDK
ncbi:MAG: hypothetical protein WBM43_09630 [Flavobacteriaceae bacterium]